MDNKINKDCIIHKKICELYCTYSKCVNKILCQKCVGDHLEIHPKQFIYTMQNLCEIHSFDKVSKMKQVLGKFKVMTEQRIIKMYNPFEVILTPIIQRVKQFEKQSKQLMVKQLFAYLLKNKSIIQNIKITKSDTNVIKTKPQVMVEETINQVQLINQKEVQLKQNTEDFTWYADATEQMCSSAQQELSSFVKTAVRILDLYQRVQISRYSQENINMEEHHQQSFWRRYVASHEVANKGQRNNMEMTLIQSKKEMQRKEQEVKRARNQIKQKQTKIEQLAIKINDLKDELTRWEQKAERQQRQRKEALGRERKKLQQFLIKHDIISDGGHTINLSKKAVDDKYFWLIFELVPNAVELQLYYHQLTRPQLTSLYKCTTLLVLRMSFQTCDKQFLSQALKCYQNLHTLQLNSSKIDDDVLKQISLYFPNKLKHLHLIDNQINDDGLQYMFLNIKCKLQSLLVSYNNLTPRAIELINKYCYQIKVLHISKNSIKNKGANSIGKYLKDLEQLFIGGTGVQKQGFLAICRGCLKLKRLSLVQTEVSIDIISQFLLGLQKLEWLDISYSNLSEENIEKIEKLKIYNKGVDIVIQS